MRAREAGDGRPFGTASATALVVANMVGAGVFTTSGFALADLGSRSQVLVAWAIGLAIALCGALSYGGLVRRITESGGEYLFLARVVHPLAGFLAGWVSLLAGFTGAIAFAATAFEVYAVPAGARPAWLPEGAVAVATVLVCGLLHGVVVRWGVLAQNAVVVAKLVLLALFVAWSLATLGEGGWPGLEAPGPAAAFAPAAFAAALVWISLAYSGFNAAVYIAGEVRNAGRAVPRALLAGTVVVGAAYLVLNAIFLYAAPPDRVSGAPDVAAVAAGAIGGPAAAALVRVAVALALFSSVSSMIVAGPRVYARMAADGVFPRAVVSTRGAVVLQVGLALVVVLASTLQSLLSYLGFVLSLSAAGAVSCLFLLRRREGPGAVAGSGYPLAPAIFVVASVGLGLLAASHRPVEWLAAVATIASGAVAYRIMRRRAA